MEEGYSLNTISLKIEEDEGTAMDVPEFFEAVIYILMVTTFIALILAFLHLYYTKEEGS